MTALICLIGVLILLAWAWIGLGFCGWIADGKDKPGMYYTPGGAEPVDDLQNPPYQVRK